MYGNLSIPAFTPSTEHPFFSIGNYLKTRFGCKVIKLSLDGGFTCPNRDGTKSADGCLFCSAGGAGEMASDIPGQIRLLSRKWPSGKYIAYFQNHTNTYAPVEVLRAKYEAALDYRDEQGTEIIGLAIATRPDCLSDAVLDLLKEFSQKTFLWVELGLQTIHEETAHFINRCYPLSVFDAAMEKLAARGIRTVVHLIFGLPKSTAPDGEAICETREEMLASLAYVCRTETGLQARTAGAAKSLRPFGVKLHLLNVVRGSSLEALCPSFIPFESPDAYVSLVVDALERIPPEITIHRLTADAPRKILIAPEWSCQKRTILNNIQKELRNRESWQGKMLPVQ